MTKLETTHMLNSFYPSPMIKLKVGLSNILAPSRNSNSSKIDIATLRQREHIIIIECDLENAPLSLIFN